MAKVVESEEDFLQAFINFEREEEEEVSPVMKISNMSEKQIRRLSIAPAFREELDRVYAKKAAENGVTQEEIKNTSREEKREENRSIIPVPPKIPRNFPKMATIKEKEEENKQKYTGTKPKTKGRETEDLLEENGAPNLNLDYNPNSPDFSYVSNASNMLPPGFNVKSSNPAWNNNPLFHNFTGTQNSNGKALAVSQWPIKYEGNDNGIGLNLFLRRVEFFAQSENMTKADLFRSAHFLLIGAAQDWFVAKWPILRTKDWDYFIQALRNQFLPKNIDHYIKIRSFSMHQGKFELFSNFLVRMEQFFLCRTTPLPDQDKFEIIWHTIRPTYRDKLALMDVKDLNSLENLCTKIDNSNEALMNRFVLSFENNKVNEVNGLIGFESSLPSNQTANPHNNINRNQQQNTQQNQRNNQNNFRRPTNTQNPFQNTNHPQNQISGSNHNRYGPNQSRVIEEYRPENSWRDLTLDDILRFYKTPDRKVCFNCRKFGHHYTRCYSRRTIFCCSCGLPEFHYEECPFCESKNQIREN